MNSCSTAAVLTTAKTHTESECMRILHVIEYLEGSRGRRRMGLHHGKTNNFKLNVRTILFFKSPLAVSAPQNCHYSSHCLPRRSLASLLVFSLLTIPLPMLRSFTVAHDNLSSPSLTSKSDLRPGLHIQTHHIRQSPCFPGGRCPTKYYALPSPVRQPAWLAAIQSQQSQ